MTEYLGNPKVQYFESGTAEALAGGKLYTYITGTTTKTPTYPTSNDAKNRINPNTNPIILDSRGETDVIISGSTKLVLTDKDDNTIWTVDGVVAPSTAGNQIDENNNLLLAVISVTNSVNYHEMRGAVTGAGPLLTVTGAEVNADYNTTTKGSGTLLLDGGSTGTVDINTTSTGDVNLKSNTSITGATTTTVGGVVGGNITVSGNSIHTGTTTLTGATTVDGALDIQNNKGIKINGNNILTPASASAQGAIRLYEDTDNGTNYTGIQAPTAITTTKTFTLPDADGTDDTILGTDGATTLGWKTPIGWRHLNSTSGDSPNNFVLNDAYTQYKITFSQVDVTDRLSLRTSLGDANPSLVYDLTSITHDGSSTTYNNRQSANFYLVHSTAQGGPDTITGTVSGELYIYNPAETSGMHITGNISWLSGTTLVNRTIIGQDIYTGTNTYITVSSDSSGNAGSISSYGLEI